MKDSWLKPSGQIIEVGNYQHDGYAYELLEEKMGMEALHDYMEEHDCLSATEVLHTKGWVRITYNTAFLPRIAILGNCVSLVSLQRNTIDPRMNSKQLKVARQLCKDNNTTLHVAVNDKRFW